MVPVGLIPAHAGKTFLPSLATTFAPAHPRSRGENIVVAIGALVAAGSSPLTRGKPPVQERSRHVDGLIPAHAGKTLLWDGIQAYWGAHPRSRGENPCTRGTS